MRAIIPQQLTILSSTIPEDEYPAWDAATAYAVGDRCIDNHYIFECVTASTNEKPFDNNGSIDKPWRVISITNQYACLDDKVYTQSSQADGSGVLTFSVPFVRPAGGIALMNVSGATSLDITLTHDTEGVIWSVEDYNLLEPVDGWYKYLYSPYRRVRDFSFLRLPKRNGTLQITISGTAPALGVLIAGEVVSLGRTLYGPAFGPKDYSIAETDDFGNLIYVERKKTKIGTFGVYIRPDNLDYVSYRISEIGKRLTLWVGGDCREFQAMHIYGRMKQADFSLSAYRKGEATYDIEGVV